MITLAALLTICTAITTLAIFGTGWGKTVTVTGTSQQVTGFSANTLVVLNAGSGIIKALVNISTTDFDTRVTAGTVITIPANMSFTFDSQAHDSISSVCLVTTGSTNVCYLGGF